MKRVKPPRFAGSWYQGSPAGLERQTSALLDSADVPAIAGAPVGVIVPHAGYQYSGATAAVAYRSVRGRPYRRAVILAPSHHSRFRGAATLDVDAFATPLGEIPVDRAALELIADQPLVREDARPYRDEHAIEIQLPLLQRVLPAVAIVPLLVGGLESSDLADFATVLARLAGHETLFVVSSDFTHYGSSFGYLPFPPAGAEPVRKQLRELDMGAINCVVAGDVGAFLRYVTETGATICGREPVAAFLTWGGRSLSGSLLAYTTSLDLTGDFEHSVSYAAIAFVASFN
jgi:AmmeMemoRadiSam system protein B